MAGPPPSAFWLSPAAIGERLNDASQLRAEVSRLSDYVGAIRVETASAKAGLETLKRACADKFAQRGFSVGGTRA